MNRNRRVVQGAILTGALAVVTTVTGASTAPTYTKTETAVATAETAQEQYGSAGVVRRLGEATTSSLTTVSLDLAQNEVVLVAEAEDTENGPVAGVVADIIPEDIATALVEGEMTEPAEEAAPAEETALTAEAPAAEDTETAEEALPETEELLTAELTEDAIASGWETKLMATVEDSLNVRESADEESAIIGKLYAGAAADVVEQGEEWTHIVSGSVDGYVKNEYCVFGADAYAYALENCTSVAKTTTGGLRFRAEASEDAGVISTLEEGTSLTVAKDVDTEDGWVAVSYSGSDGFVAADYVEVTLNTTTALTLEEEQEKLAAEQAEKAKTAQVSATGTATQTGSTAASYDDVTLLAALIQCESGSQPYEGQVAVGNVVVNRLRSGAYGGSIASVIYAPGQFGPAGSGAVARVAAAGPSATAIAAAQAALNGENYIGACTQFRNVACGHPGTVIGSHVFW